MALSVARVPATRPTGSVVNLAASRTTLATRTSRRDVRARGAAAASAIPPEYGCVIATVGFGVAVCQWMMFGVSKARIAIGLKYPALYAEGDSEDEMKFNCTQRAHQNTLETAPLFTVLIAVLGLARPFAATGLGVAYYIGRIIYFLGYGSGIVSRRTPGSIISFLTLVGAIFYSLYTGGQVSGLFGNGGVA